MSPRYPETFIQPPSSHRLEPATWVRCDVAIYQHIQEPAGQTLDWHGHLKQCLPAHQPSSSSSTWWRKSREIVKVQSLLKLIKSKYPNFWRHPNRLTSRCRICQGKPLCWKPCRSICPAISIQEHVTDRQTDRHRVTANNALCICVALSRVVVKTERENVHGDMSVCLVECRQVRGRC